MEALNKIAGAVSNAIPESVTNTLFGDQHKQQQQQFDENGVPTQGPGHSTYGDKPLTTTTNETGSLSSGSSKFTNLSHTESPSFVVGEPLKDTVNMHKRADSGHAEYNEGTRFGVETRGDGIRRAENDPSLHNTTEGYARPGYHGSEDNEDGIRRSGGRERVQFDSADGSSGSLRPSHTGAALPHGDTQYHKDTDIANKVEGLTLNKPQQTHTSEAQLSKVGVTVPETYNPASNSVTLEGAQSSQHSESAIGGVVLNAGGQRDKTTGSSHGTESYSSTHPLSTGDHIPHGHHHDLNEPHHNHPAAPLAAAAITSGFAAGGISKSVDDSHKHSTEQGLPSIGRDNDVPREHDSIAGRQGYVGNTNSGEFGNISSRSGNDVGEATPSHSTGLAHATQSVASQNVPITSSAHVGQQREGLSSSNEPRAQGGPVNHATTNAVPPMGGLSQPIGGPAEPSVGAHPASGAQPTQSHQGAGRPMEHPDHPAGGAAGTHDKPEAGHQYVRSSGLAADGGDFDAAAPGAGREADRLLEEQGVHRTDHSTKSGTGTGQGLTPTKAGGIVSSLLHHGDHSHQKTNSAPHPATQNVAEPHNRTGHSSGGISGTTHTAGGATGGSTTGDSTSGDSSDVHETTTPSGGSEKKPLSEKIKEKLHLGGH